MKVSLHQINILQDMRRGITLHSSTVTGNAPPLWPVRSAWVQDYSRSVTPGMKSILTSTLDALLRQGFIEEKERYNSGNHMQGSYVWDSWTVNYRLTDKGRDIAGEAGSILARLVRTGI